MAFTTACTLTSSPEVENLRTVDCGAETARVAS
jgi:hypothetical protein